MASETKLIRINAADKIRLWDLKNSEHKSLADVVKYLLDKENTRSIIKEEKAWQILKNSSAKTVEKSYQPETRRDTLTDAIQEDQ